MKRTSGTKLYSHCSLLRRKVEGDWVSLWFEEISGADMRRFYHPHLPSIGQNIILDEKGSHHLLRVTGISKNKEVEIFDGKGRACIAILQEVKKKSAVLALIKERDVLVKDDTEYWLLVALVRPEPFSNILRMATEIVHHIVPFHYGSVQRGKGNDGRKSFIRFNNVDVMTFPNCMMFNKVKMLGTGVDIEKVDFSFEVIMMKSLNLWSGNT